MQREQTDLRIEWLLATTGVLGVLVLFAVAFVQIFRFGAPSGAVWVLLGVSVLVGFAMPLLINRKARRARTLKWRTDRRERSGVFMEMEERAPG